MAAGVYRCLDSTLPIGPWQESTAMQRLRLVVPIDPLADAGQELMLIGDRSRLVDRQGPADAFRPLIPKLLASGIRARTKRAIGAVTQCRASASKQC